MCRPASVDPGVAALRPAELLESIPECRDISLCLRSRSRESPSARRCASSARIAAPAPPAASRHAAECRDEGAPLHAPSRNGSARLAHECRSRPAQASAFRVACQWGSGASVAQANSAASAPTIPHLALTTRCPQSRTSMHALNTPVGNIRSEGKINWLALKTSAVGAQPRSLVRLGTSEAGGLGRRPASA